MHLGQFRPFSKCSHSSNLRCFLGQFLAHNNSNVVVQSFFEAFLIFDPNWTFSTGYSPCLLVNFSHFQNTFIPRILGFFVSCFCTQQFQCGRPIVFCTFLTFLIFDPYWQFCMDYSPFNLAKFGHFQNALIFGILGVFRVVFRSQQL